MQNGDADITVFINYRAGGIRMLSVIGGGIRDLTYYWGGRAEIRTSSWEGDEGIRREKRDELGSYHLFLECQSSLDIGITIITIYLPRFSKVPGTQNPGENPEETQHIPPYSLTSSEIMSITSHSKTLLSTRPQLIPGISLSDCICWSWRDSMRPAGEVAILRVSNARRCKNQIVSIEYNLGTT